MKKGLFLLIGVLSFSLTWSQIRPVRVGLNIGGNLCNLVSDQKFYNELYDWRFRFNGGIFQDIRLTDRFFIQTEISYAGLGSQTGINITDSTGSFIGRGAYKYQLHYLQIPVTFKVKFGQNIRWFVEAGPYIGALIVAKGGIDPDFDPITPFPTDNIIDNYNRVDVGFKVGGGIELPLTPGHYLVANIRYSQGFTDVTRTAGYDFNVAGTFSLAYMFDL